ncbi:MAG: efflux RND transporter periplasmic adaptor subunit [Myxococcales bacterium]|nr:efflux RND transporter periplasmic adaptor subunit [Myxococcales bacterium]MCB9534134.1 efflux RND transporter periplasmic adaptor subunit [Myxococcales bacterium]
MSDDLSAQLAALKIDRDDRSSGGSSGRWLRWLIWLLVLAALAGAGAVVVPKVQRHLATIEVEATRITSVTATDALVSVTATGYVHALRVAQLGAESLTRITEVNVSEGASVHAGDVLFVFDSTDHEAAIAAAEARVTAARARAQVAAATADMTRGQLERARATADRGVGLAAAADDLELTLAVQRAQVDAANAEIRTARAEVESLVQARDRFVVTAPFDGMVLNSPAELGAVADPTRPIVELMDPASLVIEADIPEGRMAGVADGAPCEIVFDAFPDTRYQGAVVGFAPRMDRARATATARIRVVDPPAMLPDMAVRVRFLREELPEERLAESRTVVPSSAVVEVSGAKVVFVLERDSVTELPVTLGEPLADGYELVQGPAPGTRVVKNPPPELRSGAPIRERQQ